jgi:hypothetical protein
VDDIFVPQLPNGSMDDVSILSSLFDKLALCVKASLNQIREPVGNF